MRASTVGLRLLIGKMGADEHGCDICSAKRGWLLYEYGGDAPLPDESLRVGCGERERGRRSAGATMSRLTSGPALALLLTGGVRQCGSRPSRFDLSVSGGPSRLGVAGGRAFCIEKQKTENKRGPGARGPRGPHRGSRKYAQGGPRRRRGEAASGESRKDGA